MGNSLFFRLFIFFLHVALYSSSASAEALFPSVWLDEMKQEALSEGISESTIVSTLNHIRLLPEVIKQDQAQPEFITPFMHYYNQRVDQTKVAHGQERLLRYAGLLKQLEAQYGVPQSLLIALWGMETNYGKYQGHVDTFSALSTLAYDGRRAGFFLNQLLDAMRMVDAGHTVVGQLRGSWAGAFGNMQFMPTTFMTFAVDGDADGHVDIMNSVPDALASAANYLSQVGWARNESAMLEVVLSMNFEWQNAQIYLKKPTKNWADMGVYIQVQTDREQNALLVEKPLAKKRVGPRQKLNKSFKGAQTISATSDAHKDNDLNVITKERDIPTIKLKGMTDHSSILLPQGWQGPAFMIFDNFAAIMDWNRSVNYALSVLKLAKVLNQDSEIKVSNVKNANTDALSYQQLYQLQTLLIEQGFDAGEPDGFPGIQTQSAIRAYQLSKQLPADGYASPDLFKKILETAQLRE